jgi:tRNA dimethylallyltransferase
VSDVSQAMITILGPTATGKTRLAVAVARRLGGEIISADSRQVYRGMDIGTGKDIDEYGQGDDTVPYHLIDIVDPGYEFNMFEFQRGFLNAYDEIKGRGALPILCGGTGLYIDSVLRRYKLADAPLNKPLRDELELMTDDALVKRLATARPLHNTTDSVDRDRIIRAIEIAEAGEAQEESIIPEINTNVYGLRLERSELRMRITNRLKKRLENGLIEEVEELLKAYTAEQLAFYGLEYRLVTAFVVGSINRNDMFQKLNSEIIQFAKRQEKWFRRMERDGVEITWFDAGAPTNENAEMIVKRL